jgi:hypothetical protein
LSQLIQRKAHSLPSSLKAINSYTELFFIVHANPNYKKMLFREAVKCLTLYNVTSALG